MSLMLDQYMHFFDLTPQLTRAGAIDHLGDDNDHLHGPVDSRDRFPRADGDTDLSL